MKDLFIAILLCSVLIQSCSQEKKENANKEAHMVPAEKSIPTLTKLWETDTVLTTAESVMFDTENSVLYVSNIGGVPPTAKDDDGFLSKLSISGEILELKWVEGLHAPKGMGIKEGKLFVSNIDELVEINIESGKITNRYPVVGAKFLNDITIDASGNIYCSDSGTNKIHVLTDGVVSVWKEAPELGGPNGLLHQGDRLMLATFGIGNFNVIDTETKSLKVLTDSIPGGDGVVAYGEDYLVSNWNGEVYYISASGEKSKILDTKEAGLNAADIEFIPASGTLLVPTFFGNSVAAYQMN